jgi:hypothetical protein
MALYPRRYNSSLIENFFFQPQFLSDDTRIPIIFRLQYDHVLIANALLNKLPRVTLLLPFIWKVPKSTPATTQIVLSEVFIMSPIPVSKSRDNTS